MLYYSTREVAKKLGIPYTTLATYIAVGKVSAPRAEIKGKTTTQIWTEAEIEHVRQLLPKIANGRKTRYSKLREKQKAPAKSPVPRKKRKATKKKTTTKPPKANG
jgi:sRNA-binding protein